MKKLIIVLITLFVITNLFCISRTKTMTQTQLQNLRNAVNPDSSTPGRDDYMRLFWCNYVGQDTMNTREFVDNERAEMYGCNTYVREAIWGAVEHDAVVHDPVITPDQMLDLASDYLLYPLFDYYLDLLPNGEVFTHLKSTHNAAGDPISGGARAFTLLFLLHDVSFISDMIWYHPGVNTDSLYSKITRLADFAVDSVLTDTPENLFMWPYNIINGNTWSDSDYPMANANVRIALLGALGYAGCVIGGTTGDAYIDTVKYQLFDKPIPADALPAGHPSVNGYLNLLTANCGLYSEGISYTALVMESLSDFFTARYRLTGGTDNLYDKTVIQNMLKESLHYIDSEFSFVGFDDCSSRRISGNSEVASASIMEMLLSCYNYTTDLELKAAIGWYVNGYMNHSSVLNFAFDNQPYGSISISGSIYGTVMYRGWRGYCSSLYGFDTEFASIASYTGVPSEIMANTHTNNEFTIFRSDINTTSDFEDATLMYINHKNSFNISGHEHDDATSFQLFFKGIPLITDPGYGIGVTDSHRKWLRSAYAHNLIIINPDSVRINMGSQGGYSVDPTLTEDSFLIGTCESTIRKEPIGAKSYSTSACYQPEEIRNPVIKRYIIEQNSLKHLSIDMDYAMDTNCEETNLNRNFYNIDNEYFIIFDNITNDDIATENEYQLRLHLSPYKVDDANYSYSLENNGKFFYQPNISNDNVNLHGACGSSGLFSNEFKPDLPFGAYSWGGTSNQDFYKHCIIKVNSSYTAGNEQFLTLLIPSESSTNPIDPISQVGATYVVKFSLNTGYDCYTAVSEASSVYYGDTRFVTDASFLLVEANNTFTDLTKLILNSDNFLEVRDMTGTDFTNVVVFNSYYDSEEVIAEWSENNELEITTVMSFTSPIPLPIPNPKYKILRCGVLPEDLISKTHYYSSGDLNYPDRGTINNNIESLAFDDNYFYVNYSYSNLASENLLTDELTIYSGTFDNIGISGISKFGLGEIEFSDKITIPTGTELKFIPGSNPLMSEDTQFVVSGQVTAIGDSLSVIEFEKKSLDNWIGFYIDSDGEVDFQYCKFSNAIIAIQCFGDIDLTNSEITNCGYGLYINSPTSYKVNDNAIYDCNKCGVYISNTSSLITACHFENNTIYDCKYGLFLYNTNAAINDNAIYNNDDKGVYISRKSHPVILLNYIGNTRNGVIDNPEIYLIGDSYPVLDYKFNDIIIESGGDSKSIYNASGADNQYYCRNNFWGDGITTTEISQSFYPLEWEVIFQPICDSTNTGFTPPFGIGDRLFDEGLEAEMDGDLLVAKEKYLLSIEENPDDVESLWSASRLLNCVDLDIGFGYNEVQQLYEDIMTDSLNTDLYELSKQNAINCDRQMENFQEAIYQYEIMFDDSLSVIDSVFTQLDIVYTYMEAEAAGGRASVLRFFSDDHAVRNFKHAREMENDLLALLMRETNNGGVYSPIIEKVKLHGNYPNPFNPTTLISFSIPDESKVNLSVYNIKGQKVKTLVNDNLAKGIHEVLWNGRNDNNRSVASGVYFYKLSVNDKNHSVKKCLMLK